MKRIIFTYGLISGGIVAFASLGLFFLSKLNQHLLNEWLGYLVMVIALSLVFFGVKSYRDNYLGGVIKFKTAFGVGLGISLISSLLYTVGWETYLQNTGGEFMEFYATVTINRMEENGASTQEISAMKEEIAEWEELYKNPLIRIGITFTEIFPVGLIISLISAGILRRSEVLTASP